jgi:hypothetical protein
MLDSPWRESWRADPELCAMADRHYPRRMRGAVGLSDQFVAPGRCLVLKTFDGSAGWVTSWPRFRRDGYADTWINTFFRNEGDMRASELITWAVAHTRWIWPDTPPQGMITFIDPEEIESELPGYCYRRAKFRHAGESAVYRRLILQLHPARMPAAAAIPFAQGALFGARSA